MPALSKIEKKYEAAIARVKSVREVAKRPVEVALTAVGTVGSSFGFGYLAGRYGDLELGGVPMLPIGGAVGHVAGLLLTKKSRMASSALHAISNGALSSYADQGGFRLGLEAAVDEVGGTATMGSIIDNRDNDLNDDGSAIDEEE